MNYSRLNNSDKWDVVISLKSRGFRNQTKWRITAFNSNCGQNCGQIVIQNHGDGFFGFSGCADDHALVIPERIEPALDIGGVIAEGLRCFNPEFVHDRARTDLRDEFFL